MLLKKPFPTQKSKRDGNAMVQLNIYSWCLPICNIKIGQHFFSILNPSRHRVSASFSKHSEVVLQGQVGQGPGEGQGTRQDKQDQPENTFFYIILFWVVHKQIPHLAILGAQVEFLDIGFLPNFRPGRPPGYIRLAPPLVEPSPLYTPTVFLRLVADAERLRQVENTRLLVRNTQQDDQF